MPGTQEPQAVEFILDDRKIVLVDTPGFDDDKRSDIEILRAIAKWLSSKDARKKRKLDGLILLHPITRNRIGERIEPGEVWHEMFRNGATITRHQNTQKSAHDIIRVILKKSVAEKGGIELLVQNELRETDGNIAKTSVGKGLRNFLEHEITEARVKLAELDEYVPANPRLYREWKDERAQLEDDIRYRQYQLWGLDKLVIPKRWFAKLKFW
ncbi:GTP-binding protein A [Echria macrotheca]|uniref:GTP-binding protein A n=1 Tax=Echria macrotheca TaxID=438768 RepID=A0AAJ0B8B3_9PEZI|nr:GTP-binding protein A [Echria macrotheca]